MKTTFVVPAALATFAALIVALMGATITDLGPWYQGLEKPDWNPADGLFPIIWTAIFALITVAGITAWRAAPNRESVQTIIALFALNAFLNIGWSIVFFRLQRPDWAIIELGLLWLSILALVIYTARFSRLASLLLVPYLIWVSIAGALNWEIVQLNAPFG